MEKAGKYNSCQTVVCRLVRGVGEKQAKVERKREGGRWGEREREREAPWKPRNKIPRGRGRREGERE